MKAPSLAQTESIAGSTERASNRQVRRVGLFLSAGLTYLGLRIVALTGWIPQDEGTLGSVAVRILRGEIPHVDFQDVYPGLQGLFHAALFSIFGDRIATTRFAWVAVGVVTALCFYVLAVKYMREVDAVLVSSGAVLVGFVFYPASMPSWWNIALGALALAVLLGPQAPPTRSRAVLAGLITGVNLLVKTTAAFLAIPLLVGLLVMDQDRRRGELSAAVIASLVLTVAVVAPVVSAPRILLLVAPISLMLAWFWQTGEGPARANTSPVRRLGSVPYLYFFFTLLLPTIVAGIYTVTGHGAALLEGWLLSPARRFDARTIDLPLDWGGLALIVLVVGGSHIWRRRFGGAYFGAVAASVLMLIGLLNPYVLHRVVVSMALWLPLLIAALSFWVRRKSVLSDEAAIIAFSAVMFALVQIPFWTGIYAAYTVPLSLLALALLALEHVRLLGIVTVVGGLIISLHAVAGQPPQVATWGGDSVTWVELSVERGGIRIPSEYAYYGELADAVSAIGEQGVYALPDSPEVPYLSSVTPANPDLWEALDPEFDEDGVVTAAERGIPVVINHQPFYSSQVSDPSLEQIYAHLPNSEWIGRFEIRWKE